MTQEFDFIISPYTRSDSSNNKLWPYERWQALVDRLLPLGTVCVLGAEGDPQVFGGVTYLFDRPLREVCGHIANVRRLVLSLDNGISHIAHSLRVPHFMFYPVTHSPIWTENRNANAVRIVAPPLTVSVDHAWATIESALQQPYSA
jgi:ADP-heptose:LPS heptosyltransferase